MSHFDRDDDIMTVRQIQGVSRATGIAIEKAEHGPKQTIRDMTRENDELRENSRRSEPADAVQAASLHRKSFRRAN